MLEDVRKYVEAAFESLNPSRARELAGSMVKGQPTEHVNRVARELLSWSQRSRERITELVQAEVKRQLKAIGIATRDDLDTLRSRVRELERSGRSARAGSGAKSTARKSTSRKSAARRSPAKRSSPKGSPSKKSRAGKPAAKGPAGPSSSSSSSSSSSGPSVRQGSSG